MNTNIPKLVKVPSNINNSQLTHCLYCALLGNEAKADEFFKRAHGMCESIVVKIAKEYDLCVVWVTEEF
jgi:hypothetical protein